MTRKVYLKIEMIYFQKYVDNFKDNFEFLKYVSLIWNIRFIGMKYN